MLKINCDFCKKELNEPGALLFSPPRKNDFQGLCDKYHICVNCFDLIRKDIRKIEIENQLTEIIEKRVELIKNNNFISPGFQNWMEKLPDKLHIGKKVRVLKGSHAGREGIVTDHWQNLDDCSGGYGNHLYQLEGDLGKYGCRNNSCAINAKDCEILKEEDIILGTCLQCDENAFDGYICHSCGAKNI